MWEHFAALIGEFYMNERLICKGVTRSQSQTAIFKFLNIRRKESESESELT